MTYKIIFSYFAITVVSIGVVFSAGTDLSKCASGKAPNDPFCYDNGVIKELRPHQDTDGVSIANILVGYVKYLLSTLYIIAVIIGLYGGFTIMKALEDEEQVKKGRKIILYAILGIVVIFLASTIVRFFIGSNSQEGLLNTSGQKTEVTP